MLRQHKETSWIDAICPCLLEQFHSPRSSSVWSFLPLQLPRCCVRTNAARLPEIIIDSILFQVGRHNLSGFKKGHPSSAVRTTIHRTSIQIVIFVFCHSIAYKNYPIRIDKSLAGPQFLSERGWVEKIAAGAGKETSVLQNSLAGFKKEMPFLRLLLQLISSFVKSQMVA
jgi:hypothetical protein